MKKAIMIILIMVVLTISVVGFIGCSTDEQQNANSEFEFSDRFVVIYNQTKGFYTYIEMYDKNTKVMYGYMKLNSGGSLTVLVNADGTPMLYEGE